MRNHLSKIFGLADTLRSQLLGLVHPEALGDPLQEPRHLSFLAGCLGSGALGLMILPLHLALAGPTSLPVALMLAWLLGQLPLALFVSQTGRLTQAHAISAALFAVFLGGLCLMTGGLSSFALIWLAVVPMEAALSGSRRVILAAAGLCLSMVLCLAVLGPMNSSYMLQVSQATAISAIAACLYMCALAFRVALDQKRSRAAMNDSQSRLALLNETANDVICAVEADGMARVLGGALETMLGVPLRQARGDWLFQRVHVSDRPLYLTLLANARSGKECAPAQLRLRKGANLPGETGAAEFIWTEACFRETSGELRLILQDVTERRRRDAELDRAREAAEEVSIAKTRFIASASHELRTPLNAIIGFSDMLRGDVDARHSGSRNKEYAELIHQSGMHLLQLVEDILDTSRIETGHMDLSIEPVDLAECLQSCRAMLTPIADRAGVTMVFPHPDSLPVMPADRRALKQIVINLLTNAVNFSPEGSTVTVDVRRDGTFLVLSVRDTGVGISAEMIELLGQPFVRVASHDETGAGRSGSGLGLSIVKGLAELHGGTLDLESRQGRGTTASVRLPAGSLKQVAHRADAQFFKEHEGKGASDGASLARSA